MPTDLIAHPVLTSDEAKRFEAALFGGDEAREWQAMQSAGAAVADAVQRDWRELAPWPRGARLLALVGKGHNGGDALLAAQRILWLNTDARVDVVLVFGERALRPLALRALQTLMRAAPGRVRMLAARDLRGPYEVGLDGVFGFQFRSPIEPRVAEVLARVNATPIRLRAAIDLPSGLGDRTAFRADFTYATGSVKTPTVDPTLRDWVGRLRYLDLGFFDAPSSETPADAPRVLSDGTLDALRGWRAPFSDKRDYGHLFVVGGSRNFPGAIMMTVQAALRAGVGLLTAFVPETFVGSYAAAVPEAMWVGCPETAEGGLALDSLGLVRARVERATALAMGPGMGRERETLTFAQELLRAVELPAVIDADALQPEIVNAGRIQRVVTPHAGEFKRLAGEQPLRAYASHSGAITVLKGAPTRISDGRSEYISLAGGPVLARGGSGDTLAGMIGGLLAQRPDEPLAAACCGTLWHGLAADALARAQGPVSARTTQLLDYLSPVLRNEGMG